MSGSMNQPSGENPEQNIIPQRNVTYDPPIISANHREFRPQSHHVTFNLSENSYHEITRDSKINYCSRRPLRDWKLGGRRRRRNESQDRLRVDTVGLDSKPGRSSITAHSYIDRCIRKADGALLHLEGQMPKGSSTLELVLRDLDGRRKESRDGRTRTRRRRDISPIQTTAVRNP